jgi:hypothetical protein
MSAASGQHKMDEICLDSGFICMYMYIYIICYRQIHMLPA